MPRPGLRRSADAFSAKYWSIPAEPDSPFWGSVLGGTFGLPAVRIVLTYIVRCFGAIVYFALVNAVVSGFLDTEECREQ
jgi:hypothetical protein